jgi:pyruvate formate lyase activating enzyme
MSASDDPGKLKGYIHSVETAGTVDGPGIRYVLFLSGCALHCLYCHNPDSHKMKEGRLTDVDAVMEDISHYTATLKRMRGGVTISGGDPLVQPEFAEEILRRCKALGLHTALDTSGYQGASVSDEFLEQVDLVLLDIKASDPALYRRMTGGELRPTLDFATRLALLEKPVWVRFVLVPGLTDDPGNIRGVAKIVAELPNVQRIDILPFHKLGEYKWKERHMPYQLADTKEPTKEMVDAAKKIFAEEGVAAL